MAATNGVEASNSKQGVFFCRAEAGAGDGEGGRAARAAGEM